MNSFSRTACLVGGIALSACPAGAQNTASNTTPAPTFGGSMAGILPPAVAAGSILTGVIALTGTDQPFVEVTHSSVPAKGEASADGSSGSGTTQSAEGGSGSGSGSASGGSSSGAIIVTTPGLGGVDWHPIDHPTSATTTTTTTTVTTFPTTTSSSTSSSSSSSN